MTLQQITRLIRNNKQDRIIQEIDNGLEDKVAKRLWSRIPSEEEWDEVFKALESKWDTTKLRFNDNGQGRLVLAGEVYDKKK